jgi:Adenosylmethionine decarboxylase
MEVEWVAYTRKDFQFPLVQKFPHRDPNEESVFLKKFFPEGDAYVLGPLTGDHWFVYVADYVDRPTEQCVDRTLNLMMFNISEDVAKLFFLNRDKYPLDSDVTKAAGIHTLLPGSQIQEFCFEPCGYSMNGLLYDSYWTIHITPESHCSYASFETNIRMPNYISLIKAVLAIFQPKRFSMTLFADASGMKALRSSPFQGFLPIVMTDSPSPAVMGPCVVSTDTFGNNLIDFPHAIHQQAQSSSSTASEEDLSSGAGAAAAPVSSLPPIVAPKQSTAGAVSADGSSTPGTPSRRSVSAQSKRILSFVQTAKCSTDFVGEYVATFGNFKHVSPTQLPNSHSHSSLALDSVPEAAKAELSMPRAKYILPKKIEQLRTGNRIRSDSL